MPPELGRIVGVASAARIVVPPSWSAKSHARCPQHPRTRGQRMRAKEAALHYLRHLASPIPEALKAQLTATARLGVADVLDLVGDASASMGRF
jgi:hypothetical protein